MAEHLLALTTLGNEADAFGLARELLDRRLVACVNIIPGVRSLYRFRGVLEDDREHVLLMKTRAERYDELAAAIQELHPYDVPELIAIGVDRGLGAYLAWVDESVTLEPPDRSE